MSLTSYIISFIKFQIIETNEISQLPRKLEIIEPIISVICIFYPSLYFSASNKNAYI